MIFTQTIRKDTSPKSYTESTFSYLDRSSRPDCGRIRSLITDWCDRVPNDERHEFVQRIKSGDDIAFHSAFLELYTHELLLSTHHTVAFHPSLPGTTKRPDFLVTDNAGNEAIVECTVATEDSDADRAAQARLNTLYDSINRVKCDDVFLALRIAGTPDTPVPGRRWRRSIQQWVDALDYEGLLAMGPVPNDADLPRLDLEHDGVHVTIKPIPKKPSARGKGQRPIGIQSFQGCTITSHNEIRDTVREKAGRYGTMTRPYIVVVNCLGPLADEEEIHGAMFGFSGIWRNVDNPTHTRVSAVLAFQQLLPWSIAVVSARLFQNPDPSFPYTGPLVTLPQSTCDSDVEGLHPREIVQVDKDWPGK
ncbi:hypothetical protein [Roseiconus lacunae]|uniref:hypothetical protein n=1 Tax=Roseiconus lacunae TaxID=2605694 RepID=UPI001E342989|nr:hypothetical protein [Roseiconus lacunae]MCD0458621.1 hypothetical protein [Roseiconus lacunae]